MSPGNGHKRGRWLQQAGTLRAHPYFTLLCGLVVFTVFVVGCTYKVVHVLVVMPMNTAMANAELLAKRSQQQCDEFKQKNQELTTEDQALKKELATLKVLLDEKDGQPGRLVPLPELDGNFVQTLGKPSEHLLRIMCAHMRILERVERSLTTILRQLP